MSAKPDPVDPVTLRDLVPLNTLSEERLQEVAALATPERLPAGETVFRTGEADHQTVFLVFGEVELTGSDGASRTVWHGMEEARHPLADHQPRDATAVTVTDVHLLRIDNSMLDYVVAW
ncbi:MAG: cyclic nucleotide-binding domain-containing protein, partial [Gammaproteobacteria bacterium]|nr:cyclic nucleotide-binding domain-containing protein [Gammaproteobacteria bacterium]